MELVKTTNLYRIIKIYLKRHVIVNTNLDYNIDGTIVSKEFVSQITRDDETPVMYLRNSVNVIDHLESDPNNKESCLVIVKIQDMTYIPIRLVERVEIVEKYITLTPQLLPAQNIAQN